MLLNFKTIDLLQYIQEIRKFLTFIHTYMRIQTYVVWYIFLATLGISASSLVSITIGSKCTEN